MGTFTIKQHDTLPSISATLTQGAGSVGAAPVDLTAATAVVFHMRPWDGGEPVVSAPGSFVDKPTGRVAYTWAPGDTDTVGDFAAEWSITWPTGAMTFPSAGYDLVRITDDIA